MVYRTLDAVLYPDGTLTIPEQELPDRPTPVMITIMVEDEAAALSQPGDYLETLRDYEEQLARGEISWQ